MADPKRTILLSFLALLSVAAAFLNVRLTRAIWSEHDARGEVYRGPTPTLENIAPHDRALASLRMWRTLAGASSILSLGGLVFLHQRRKEGVRVWTRAALLGMLSFLMAFLLLLSTSKQGVSAEREVGIPMLLFALVAGGVTVGSALLAWVTGRIGPRIVGVVLMLLAGLGFAGAVNLR